MSTPEGKVVRYFQQVAFKHGCVTRKVVYVARRGCPDQLLIGPGAVYLCELKAAKGRPSVAQNLERDILNSVYGDTLVHHIYGKEGVDRFFEEMFS